MVSRPNVHHFLTSEAIPFIESLQNPKKPERTSVHRSALPFSVTFNGVGNARADPELSLRRGTSRQTASELPPRTITALAMLNTQSGPIAVDADC
jgi:hypothetical protein